MVYVEASRARHGTDWFVNRDDLGEAGHDADRIDRLAANMRRSRRRDPVSSSSRRSGLPSSVQVSIAGCLPGRFLSSGRSASSGAWSTRGGPRSARVESTRPDRSR